MAFYVHDDSNNRYNLSDVFDSMIANKVSLIANLMFPVGSIYCTDNPDNPRSYLGIGTWEKLEGGRCVVAQGDWTDTDGTTQHFAAGDKGGHTHRYISVSQLPKHYHNMRHQHNVISTQEGIQEPYPGDRKIYTDASDTAGGGWNNFMLRAKDTWDGTGVEGTLNRILKANKGAVYNPMKADYQPLWDDVHGWSDSITSNAQERPYHDDDTTHGGAGAKAVGEKLYTSDPYYVAYIWRRIA